jgi:sugar phosphate isomerase/epimerase
MRRQIAPLAPHLKSLGLRPVSMHFETPLITGNWQAWKDADMPPVDERLTFERALEESQAAGIANMVFNYLPPKERGDLNYYRALSDKLNAAAGKCRSAGMRLWYHNHNFEFMPKSGGRPMDILLERLDKKLISLEVDLFWVSMAGVDAADFIRRNAARIAAVHLKDRARNAVVPKYDIASVPNDTFAEVGRGDLNFGEIFKATFEAGVKHYFVEQDHSPDPEASIRRSYTALRKLGF